jgi:hypothetical protein
MMARATARFMAVVSVLALSGASAADARAQDATTAMTLDHNRLLIDAEIQQADGQWYPARLWVDTGNPDFMISAASATKLGFAGPPRSQATEATDPVELTPPRSIRIGGVPIDITGLKPSTRLGARQWGSLGADANLPSTVLRRYRVIVDYPRSRFTLVVERAGKTITVTARVMRLL